MPLLPPIMPFPVSPATRSDTPHPDTHKAIGKVQRAVAVTSLLREELRDLWGESNPKQATLIQECLQLESEAMDRLQLIREKLNRMPELQAEPRPSGAA